MPGLMEVLDAAPAEPVRSSGRSDPPEMLSRHQKPASQAEYVRAMLAAEFPDGLVR